MTTDYPSSLAEARSRNYALHGSPKVARAHAEDMGYHFCEDCYAVSHVVPYYVNDGHQCLTDGTAEKFALKES